jgi:hypothetical protein
MVQDFGEIPKREDFGILGTGDVKGKSSKLLTHKVSKEHELLDAGGSQLLISL